MFYLSFSNYADTHEDSLVQDCPAIHLIEQPDIRDPWVQGVSRKCAITDGRHTTEMTVRKDVTASGNASIAG